MNWQKEWRPLALIGGVFLVFFYLPAGIDFGGSRVGRALVEALLLAKWYAREHVVFCLVPAFFIAGAIAVFISQGSVMKYLGARANKIISYGVASVSGSVLAVCSCTVLPLFAGIYRMGAGLGPATAFLYAGPAVNVLAIILTARVLGAELGVARAVGAVVFSVVIGVLMHVIFLKEEKAKAAEAVAMSGEEADEARPLWMNSLYFGAMIGILVFANWGEPGGDGGGFFASVYAGKWLLTSAFAVALAGMLVAWFGVVWWKVAAAAVPVVLLAVAVPGQPMLAFGAGVVGLSAVASVDRGGRVV